MAFKKFVSFLMAIMIVFASSVSAMAYENGTSSGDTPDYFIVYSPEFPDVEIEATYTAVPQPMSRSATDDEPYVLGYVDANVYCIETHEVVNGEDIIVDSKIVTKEEFDAFGTGIQPLMSSEERTASKELLTIRFTEMGYSTGNRYQLTANAEWAPPSITYPGSASSHAQVSTEDLIGITWGGEFNGSTQGGVVQYFEGQMDTPMSSLTQTPTLSSFDLNKGYVWSFYEAWLRPNNHRFEGHIMTFCEISKNVLTGGGNETQFGMQYTHTYGTITGSLSASISLSGPSLGFSLSNCDKQWSVAVTSVNGYPY